MKCMWLNEEGECDIRCGIADDPSCDGGEYDMWDCAYVLGSAQWEEAFGHLFDSGKGSNY